MTAADVLARGRRLAEWLSGGAHRAAAAWALATLALLLALSGAPGISRDEAAVLEAADRTLATPGTTAAPAPPLAPLLARATGATLATLGVPPVRAARAATALEGALLSGGMVLLAWPVAGPAPALLAPALFWAAPRHLASGLVASPDLLLAVLAVALALAWRRATREPERPRRIRAAIVAGVLLGAALAARADGWTLLAAFALVGGIVGGAVRERGAATPFRGIRTALLAMAVLGPVVLVASWPALLLDPAARAAAFGLPSAGAAAAALGGAAGGALRSAAFPLVAAALTVPLALLVALAAGTIYALARLWRALSRESPAPHPLSPSGGEGRERGLATDSARSPREHAEDEILLLALALVPLAAAAAGIAPRAIGVRPFLHAMPFLAVLGARALVEAARAAWPARAAPLAASLALLALWPAARATAHAFPSGGSAWSELAGGAPGAASLGLPRQEGGEAVVGLLAALDARARAGARVWWPTSSPAAVRALARDGRLRSDLTVATAPEEADLAVVTIDAAGRDSEYRAWAAFRTARPVAGVYLDEVPLGYVYAAPGAWR